jgi:uncharacterized membrane protein YhaH (DUF805 family)
LRLGRKLTISRKGYWIATSVLMVAGFLMPEKRWLNIAIFFAWMMLYRARLRDAGRSAFAMLHLLAILALLLIGAVFAPDAFLKYVGGTQPGRPPTGFETALLVASLGVSVIYYFWFSIWLGCIKPAPRATTTEIVEHFS